MSAIAAAAAGDTGTGEAVVFWLLAPVAVLAAASMLFLKKAVHSALMLALTMLCLAVLYVVQEAPFLGVVQVVVYTGAVMMLFLFVLMLVGVDSGDSLIETLRGQRMAAIALGVGFALLVGTGLYRALGDADAAGLIAANTQRGGNIQGIAALLFTNYVFAFEVTSALLIVAAVGAMVLAHKERTGPRRSQREMSQRRFAGTHPTPEPGPGVYATADSVNEPVAVASDQASPHTMGDE